MPMTDLPAVNPNIVIEEYYAKIFYLKRITPKGNFEFTQGNNSMIGTLYKEALGTYWHKFDIASQKTINKYLGKKKKK